MRLGPLVAHDQNQVLLMHTLNPNQVLPLHTLTLNQPNPNPNQVLLMLVTSPSSAIMDIVQVAW